MLQFGLLFSFCSMNTIFAKRWTLLSLCCLFMTHRGWSQYQGYVTNQLDEPLEGVIFFEENHETGTVSDAKGYFVLPFPHDHDMSLSISFTGFKTQRKLIKYSQTYIPLDTIVLIQDTALLSKVLIADSRVENHLNIQINKDFLQENFKGNFASTLELLPGMSAINVGVGISKPVIRGMSSNRVIVNNHGIRMESQQWGTDHGLEIDAFDVGQVDIVKGPHALMYGSDALGGMIRILPSQIPVKNRLSGEVSTVFKSNNLHAGISAGLGYNTGKFFVNTRYTTHRFSDFRVPADKFEYNGFVLPIMGNNLRNTSGSENNLSVEVGYVGPRSITRLRYSQFGFIGGLFSGAVGIPRSYTLREDGNKRNIETPYQHVNHNMWTLNHSYSHKAFEWTVDAGFQHNVRNEFSRPEFHRIPLSTIKDGDDLALGLNLKTFTLQSFISYKQGRDNYKLGSSFQFQDNRRMGFEFLLPDYVSQRGGLFGLWGRELNKNVMWTSSGRIDYGRNNTVSFTQYIWNSNEIIMDSLESQSIDDKFFGFSANTGLEWKWKNSLWSTHLSKSFRLPHPVETSSNGIHHGTFRHEQGQENLQPESGYQWDISAEYSKKKLEWDVSVYFNYIDNFIYLGPTFPAQFSNLPEAGQIFRYRQDKAIFTGFECEWRYNWHPRWTVTQSMDYVQSLNTVTGVALPFTPQPSLKTDLLGWAEWGKGKERFSWNIKHRYYMAAESGLRRDRGERPTPATTLFDMGVSLNSLIRNYTIKVQLNVDNIFNTPFLNHLSRYRWLNIPEQGRNLSVTVRIGWQ